MAYTGILKFLGAMVRWLVNGFTRPLSEYFEPDSDRLNFIAGIFVVLLSMLIVIPLIYNCLS